MGQSVPERESETRQMVGEPMGLGNGARLHVSWMPNDFLCRFSLYSLDTDKISKSNSLVTSNQLFINRLTRL